MYIYIYIYDIYIVPTDIHIETVTELKTLNGSVMYVALLI